MKKKYFTKKKNGIKQNVIHKLTSVCLLSLVGGILLPALPVKAAPAQQNQSQNISSPANQLVTAQQAVAPLTNHQNVIDNAPTPTTNNNQNNNDQNKNLLTYTEPFQNTTTSLTGMGVSANTYFIKPDRWDVKQATLNLNYQVSQLASDQISDITVSINGVKFYSFRPNKSNSLQTQVINIPLQLLQGSNNLKIAGQLQTEKNGALQSDQTPANWLTIYDSTNVNFHYLNREPEKTLASFYDYFTGADTINNHQCAISVPNQPTNAELTAATYTLSGFSRTITNENSVIPICQNDSDNAKNSDYRIVLGLYKDLPQEFQHEVNANDLDQEAVAKIVYQNNKHYLIVTSKDSDLLIKASRYLANQELMKESDQDQVTITNNTQTFTAGVKNDGDYQLTQQNVQLVGAGHQEATFFVNLPVNLTNASGSVIKLDMRYAKNLNFNRSLVTVYINNTAIGSQRLKANDADDDSLTVKVPADLALNGQFVVRVAFDLVQSGANNTVQSDGQTPWACVAPSSYAYVHSKPVLSQLFSNYPSLFLDNSAFDNLVIVKPNKMNNYYFETLSNIFNLMGSYALSNTGKITYCTGVPDKDITENHNMIVLGTPSSTPFIKTLNKHLYMKYNSNYKYFVSNEKMSIAPSYGQHIGTAQLLRSPYNGHLAILAVTAPDSHDVMLASTQINFQKNIQQYAGDTIVVDHDNNHYSYRFKKKKSVAQNESFGQRVHAHISTVAYFALALIIIEVIIFMLVMVFKKHSPRKGKDDLDEK